MSSRGFTLTETIVSLAISTCVISSIFSLFTKMSKQYKVIVETSSQTNIHQRISELALEIIRNYDSYPFLLRPRVHKKGLITYNDGSPNHIMNGALNRRPHPNSDAITSYKAEISGTIRVTQSKILSNSVNFEGCQRHNTLFDITRYQTYLGISADGLYELTPTSHKHLSQPYSPGPCHLIQFSLEKSMMASKLSINSIYTIKYIVPLRELYTIYIDRENNLRYLSHRGHSNIENQPIVENAPPLLISIFPSNDNKLLNLKITTTPKYLPRFPPISLLNHLSHTTYLSFLLNRP